MFKTRLLPNSSITSNFFSTCSLYDWFNFFHLLTTYFQPSALDYLKTSLTYQVFHLYFNPESYNLCILPMFFRIKRKLKNGPISGSVLAGIYIHSSTWKTFWKSFSWPLHFRNLFHYFGRTWKYIVMLISFFEIPGYFSFRNSLHHLLFFIRPWGFALSNRLLQLWKILWQIRFIIKMVETKSFF